MKIKNTLQNALFTLKQGGLVAIPTETVYGLAADAKNSQALTKIFKAKGRPIDHPVIVHIGDINQLSDWTSSISEEAKLLAQAFWPGPLTLILKKAQGVSDIITGGQDTIGIRIPKHPLALALLQGFGSGLAAPSANRFGRISPTTALHVQEELGDQVQCILDGGQCQVGVESTIVDVSGPAVRILRPGIITQQQIEDVLHKHISFYKKDAPRVSGALESHYAPQTPLMLMSMDEIKFHLLKLSSSQLPIAVLTLHCEYKKNIKGITLQAMSKQALIYAHDLYQTLRLLDKQNYKLIIVENVPEDGEWDAVRDRLKRAAN